MTFSENQSEPDQDQDVMVELPTDEKSLMQRVEAVLLIASNPLPSRKLADLATLADGTQARTVVKLLNKHYDEQGRSFHIKQIAGGYQLMTRPQFSTWLRRMDHVPKMIRLSTPAMETLAVVAYRQPVLKAEIEAIRGVNCGEMLRQLLEKGLVSIVGRSEELGRPYFYGTTKKFLEMFGLSRIEALPRAEDLKGRGLPKSGCLTQNGANPPTDQNENQLNSETLSFSTEPKTPTEEPEVSVVVDPQLSKDEEFITGELEQLQTLNPGQNASVPVASDDEYEDEDEDEEYEDEEWEDDEDDDEEEWEDDDSDGEESDDEFEDEEWDEEDDDDEEYEDDDELEDHWEEVDDDDDDSEWEDGEEEDEEDWEEEESDEDEEEEYEDDEEEWDEE